jgi:ABC-type sugar transport system ATPase subunit
MAFGLKLRKVDPKEIRTRVSEAADILGLGSYLKRKPKALSGGQRQRVALGRAIVRKPQAFLFDEPLSNLDAKMRTHMRVEIASLAAQLQTTVMYVTHDQTEAMTLGERIACLHAGKLQQVGTPLELYRNPANLFVAGFIGTPQMNLLPCTIEDDYILLGSDMKLPFTPDLASTMSLSKKEVRTMGVRPESFVLCPASETSFRVRVEIIEHLGAENLLHGSYGSCRIIAKLDGAASPERGAMIGLKIASSGVHFFSEHFCPELSDAH